MKVIQCNSCRAFIDEDEAEWVEKDNREFPYCLECADIVLNRLETGSKEFD